MGAIPEAPLLLMQGVHKSFGSALALNNVNFQLDSREIHGLLGGNGAGKTTLMNILYGLYRADAGEIHLRGQKVDIRSPKDALRYGIGMVHQHFLQVESFTVVQNVVLGTSPGHALSLDLKGAEQRIRDLAERFGLQVDPHALIEELPIGMRQKVEILKALYRGVRILILDEPTTSLTPQEVDSLFQTIRVMVKEGLSVVFITHKLREVQSVCDRITVLRDGKNVMTARREESTEEALVRAMVGEGLDIKTSILFARRGRDETAPNAGAQVVLQVHNLNVMNDKGARLVKDCTFHLCEKEILGVAGVAGNGQRELAESLMGLRPVAQGEIRFNDTSVSALGTRELLRQGVAYIPEDRLHDGFLPTASVAHNLILGAHCDAPYSGNLLLNWKTIYQASRQLIGEYNVRTLGPHDTGGNLSGGNIQRVIIARAFSRPLRLLIAHNPTRGLDLASTELVYAKMLEQKQKELAILLISEDLDELMLLSDRIAVLFKGEIMGLVNRAQFDKYQIGRMMSGVRMHE